MTYVLTTVLEPSLKHILTIIENIIYNNDVML